MRSLEIFVFSTALFFCSQSLLASEQNEEASQDNSEISSPENNGEAQEDASTNPQDSAVSNTTQLTGFYGGVNVGLDVSKAKFNKSSPVRTTKNSTRGGFLADVFTGYNCQFGNWVLGIEGSMDFTTTTNRARIDQQVTSSRKKFGFGLAPRVGYNIYDNMNGYVNFGLLASKYKVRSEGAKKNPFKTAIFVGLGVEQSFGSMFVRGEVNKVFKKTISNMNNTSVAMDSYVIKLGGGYRF